jgi:AraC family transcriptional activator FtrA
VLKTVAVVLLDDVALFEFGVLAEVFGIDRSDDGVPKLDFRVCALEAGKPLSARNGIQVIAPQGLEGLLGADLVAIPATRMRQDYPPEVLDALRQAAARGRRCCRSARERFSWVRRGC